MPILTPVDNNPFAEEPEISPFTGRPIDPYGGVYDDTQTPAQEQARNMQLHQDWNTSSGSPSITRPPDFEMPIIEYQMKPRYVPPPVYGVGRNRIVDDPWRRRLQNSIK